MHTVRFSTQGDLLVSGSEDGRVLVWDTTTWSVRYELNDAVGEVYVAEISDDGSLLAIAGDDGRVVVHRLIDGSVVFDKHIVDGRVFAMTWLGEGPQIAVGGEDAVLSIVDPVSGQQRRTGPLAASAGGIARDPGHPIEIQALAYMPQRRSLAVAMSPGGIHVLDVSTLTENGPLDGESFESSEICFINQGPGYLAATYYSFVQIWNLDDGSKVAQCSMDNYPRSLRYSHATGTLIAGLRNGTVQTWNVRSLLTGASPLGRRFLAHSGRASTAELSSDGAWLATGGQDTRIRLWQCRDIQEQFDVPLEKKPWSIEFSPCGRWVAIVDGPITDPDRITMCDARSGDFLWTTGRAASPVSAQPISENRVSVGVAFNETGSQVACLESGRIVRWRKADTGCIIKECFLPGPRDVGLLGFTPNGQSLLARDAASGPIVLEPNGNNAIDRDQSLSRWFIGMLRTKFGDFWLDSESPQHCVLRAGPNAPPTITLPGLSERVLHATTSRDGGCLAATGMDGIVYVWNLSDVGPPAKLVGHKGPVRKLYFSSDAGTILDAAARMAPFDSGIWPRDPNSSLSARPISRSAQWASIPRAIYLCWASNSMVDMACRSIVSALIAKLCQALSAICDSPA